VFHVALTRCRSSMSIIPGSPPSPFLLELAQPGKPMTRDRTPDVTGDTGDSGSPGGGSRPASVSRQATAKARDADGVVGLRFTHRGRDFEIVELTMNGVRALLEGGPATTTVAFGASVTVEGRRRC